MNKKRWYIMLKFVLHYIYCPANEVSSNVMFLHLSVVHSVHRGEEVL